MTEKKSKLINNILTAALLLPPCVPQTAASLIQALMEREPDNRLGASNTTDIQSHAFYASLDFDGLLRREILVPARTSLLSTSPATPDPCARPTVDAPVISPFTGTVRARGGGSFCDAFRACIGLNVSGAGGPSSIHGWDV